MDFYVYIIYSSVFDVYYKGSTSDPMRRLEEHNSDKSRYTSGKGPWKMVYLELMPDKRSALIREKQIKKYNRIYLEELLMQPQNLMI